VPNQYAPPSKTFTLFSPRRFATTPLPDTLPPAPKDPGNKCAGAFAPHAHPPRPLPLGWAVDSEVPSFVLLGRADLLVKPGCWLFPLVYSVLTASRRSDSFTLHPQWLHLPDRKKAPFSPLTKDFYRLAHLAPRRVFVSLLSGL